MVAPTSSTTALPVTSGNKLCGRFFNAANTAGGVANSDTVCSELVACSALGNSFSHFCLKILSLVELAYL